MELASDPRPPVSATLTAAANRRPRPLKWGCHIHDQELLKNGTAVRRALCPYIFRSGKNQGQLWLLCSDWWRDRRCWRKQPFDMSNFKYLPTWQQDWLDGNASILSSYAPCSRHLDLKPCCDLKLLRPRTMHATRTSSTTRRQPCEAPVLDLAAAESSASGLHNTDTLGLTNP